MVDQTIQRALEGDPEKRFQSASEMREALQAALREPELMRRRRRRIAFVALGVLTLSFGAAALAGASRPDVRARASAVAGPLMERLRGHKPAQAPEAVAVAAPAPNEAAATAVPEPAAPTTAGDPDEPTAAAAEQSDETLAEQGAGDESEGADEQAGPEPEAQANAEQPAPAEAEAGAAKTAPGDDLDAKLAAAAELMKNGRKVKGFTEIRRLGRKHMKDPRALKAWSEAAVMMHGWGEAHRVAERWAKYDQSVEARLHLARMQRAVGKRDVAIRTLATLLEQNPNCEEAKGMLKSYQGTAVALRH